MSEMRRIDEPKYEAMISALYTFASNVYVAASELQTLASACAQVLGEEDIAVKEIYKKVKECQLSYASATNLAKKIAAAMQEELDEARKEREVWENDQE